MAKQNLPSIYIAEKNEYNRLFDLGLTRTNTGNLTFTSISSSITYDTSVFAGGAYSNQGQEGMFLILKIVLTDYLIFAEDINDYAGSTGGTSTAYTATLTNWSKVDGALIVVKCHTDQTGVGTLNVNSSGANGLKKPNGADLINMKSGGIYPFRYSSSGNFILQGSDSAGNATSAQVLATRTCTTDAGDITGTMPNKTGTVETAVSFTGSAGIIDVIPATGFFDGSTARARITDADYIASNIKSGINIFGISGSLVERGFTSGGLISSSSGILGITGLGFTPSCVLISLSSVGSGYEWETILLTTQDIPNTTGYLHMIHSGVQGLLTSSNQYITADGFSNVQAFRLNWNYIYFAWK